MDKKFKIEKHELQMKSLFSNLRKKKVFQSKNKRLKPKLDPEQLLFSTRIENINNSNYQFEKLKLAEMTCMCLSMSGIGCSILAGNLASSSESNNENLNFLPIPLALGSIITVVLLFGIYWRAQKELK